MRIQTALISVFDKSHLTPFASFLAASGVKIISTGNTAKFLRQAGLSVRDVSDVTGFPEIMDGRVKTLHPKIHGGLLAVRDNPSHMQAASKLGIETLDLLVVNLYPFEQTLQRTTLEHEIIEMIDIGGPSMIRSASKNFRYTAAICDPVDYELVQKELMNSDMQLSQATRRRLAGKVFSLTASYDQAIANYLQQGGGISEKTEHIQMPETFHLNLRKRSGLRYGENPHQKAALYALDEAGDPAGVTGSSQLHGKELSFNNYLDLDSALEMVLAFDEPSSAVVKHTSPCGFAIGKNAQDAFKKAHACDPLSAFGGIVALNRPVDTKCAKQILASGFLECVIAADFGAEALALLSQKKNLRLLTYPKKIGEDRFDYKKIQGGMLIQERDEATLSAKDLTCVTKTKPTKAMISDMLFAFKVCRYVKSNAIVIAKSGVCTGLGMGQPSRVDSCLTAIKKSAGRSKNAVLASDGFFPKPDSIALAKKAGIKAIIQPGGSIADEQIIKACDRYKIAMSFTGIRHFKH